MSPGRAHSFEVEQAGIEERPMGPGAEVIVESSQGVRRVEARGGASQLLGRRLPSYRLGHCDATENAVARGAGL